MDLYKLARPCILRRKDYTPGKPVEEVKRELGIDDVCKLASNENPLGVSPRALAAMIRELTQNSHVYPESLSPALTQKLAAIHGVTPKHILIDNGEDGIITLLGLAFVNPGEEIVIGEATFAAYENMADKLDAATVRVPLTADYRLDIEGFLRAITPRTKMLFVCNPNNPTGTIITRGELERLLAAAPEHVLIVVDEAYREFADDADFPDAIPYIEKHPNLVVMRTFSKIMGMAGVRVGYAVAHPDVIYLMGKGREPFPVNRAAQAGALAALDDHEFVQRTLQNNRAGREQLYRALDEMGLTYRRSQSNFVMIDLGRPAEPVYQAMLRDGVIVRPLASFGMPNGLRISVGTPADNERAIAALKKALAK